LLVKGIERSRLSPYVVRGPVPRNMFFGRQAELKRLSQNLHNHAVVGGRRMGKSSMFLRLRRLWSQGNRVLPYYVNCEACFDHDDFLATVNDVVKPAEEFETLTDLRRGLTWMAKERPNQVLVFLLDEVDELLVHDERGRLFKMLRQLLKAGQRAEVGDLVAVQR